MNGFKSRTDAEIYKIISENIKVFRSAQGFTQKDLAKKTGFSISYISKIEAGGCDKSFSIATLNQIANALEIDIEAFFVDKFKWQSLTDTLITALKNLGGKATYPQIFREYESLTGIHLDPIKKASIRKAISDHSSSSKNFKHKGDYFYSVDGIGKGVWGLRDKSSRRE